MKFTDDELNEIYEHTSGYCHICRKKLSFKNYGCFGKRGAWEVEHSNPRSKGGTNRLNNLYPACISCNRSKNNSSTKSARSVHGHRKAPLSVENRKKAKIGNALGSGALGVLAGSILGPVGSIVGGILGVVHGHRRNPDKDYLA